MIPKIIHYCWFGGNKKPPVIEHCIETWKEFCPDYEIIEWNESNYDITKNKYMKEAYEEKQWAFVSDVARLDIVNEHGGIYLDTDVELSSSLDAWLDKDFFAFFESERRINTGLGFAAVKNCECTYEMLNQYKDLSFYKNGKIDNSPCPAKNTDALMHVLDGLKLDGTTQCFENYIIYSSSDYKSVANHIGTATWDAQASKMNLNRKEYKDTRIKRVLRNPKIFLRIEKWFGKKSVRIYEWLVYDLIENGITYYVKRLLKRK